MNFPVSKTLARTRPRRANDVSRVDVRSLSELLCAKTRILESFWQIFSPFCAQTIVKRLACTGDLWKRLFSAEWDASIDHDAGIAAVVLSVVAHRVERRTPAS